MAQVAMYTDDEQETKVSASGPRKILNIEISTAKTQFFRERQHFKHAVVTCAVTLKSRLGVAAGLE